MGFQAEGIKVLRGGEPGPLSGSSKPGDRPIPKRTRGFYRALQRGELWAIVPPNPDLEPERYFEKLGYRFAKIVEDVNCPRGNAFFMWPNSRFKI